MLSIQQQKDKIHNRVKRVVFCLSHRTHEWYIIHCLLKSNFFRKNVREFYQFFGTQGGTIHQLAKYIKDYNPLSLKA